MPQRGAQSLRERSSPGAAHSGFWLCHKPAPFSAFFHIFHIPPRFSYIGLRALHPAFPSPLPSTATHCGSAVLALCALLAVVHSCTSAPDRGGLCDGVPRVRSYRRRVHVVRFCPTLCPTTRCLFLVDWLTGELSSASTLSAIGIGKPLLFGARMHRSHWPSCTS